MFQKSDLAVFHGSKSSDGKLQVHAVRGPHNVVEQVTLKAILAEHGAVITNITFEGGRDGDGAKMCYWTDLPFESFEALRMEDSFSEVVGAQMADKNANARKAEEKKLAEQERRRNNALKYSRRRSS